MLATLRHCTGKVELFLRPPDHSRAVPISRRHNSLSSNLYGRQSTSYNAMIALSAGRAVERQTFIQTEPIKIKETPP
jgi:hypothetical protein